MFIEPNISKIPVGWIEVICGSMFSGKTEELIRRLIRAKIANQNTLIFKPSIDIRYNQTDIVSHDQKSLPSLPVNQARQILDQSQDAQVVGIDEAQFFDSKLVDICEQLALQGKRVIVAGLDMDFKKQPFGPMPQLLAIADYITKLHAVCVICGGVAGYSYRQDPNKEQVLVGEKDKYQARCRTCYHL